ncbi:hypothetical protein AB4672_21815 [Bacillus paralicheniformis]|uniref:hypothetical protein n=1 Tax=Bacillus paralicheniformis TaxID=1648923 RepID=UPI0034D18F63
MKIKKVLKSLFIVSALLISAVGTTGLIAPQKAEAKYVDWLWTKKSGSFKNYVETKSYHPTYKGKKGNFKLLEFSISSKSKGKGTYKLYLQKKSKKGSWKTIKTVNAKKNGRTSFDASPKIKYGDYYRLKLVNKGSKKEVKYSAIWIEMGGY